MLRVFPKELRDVSIHYVQGQGWVIPDDATEEQKKACKKFNEDEERAERMAISIEE